jgi:hypothetical protein
MGMRLVAAAVAVAAIACTTQQGGSQTGDARGVPDASMFDPPGSITVRVRNDGNRNLYVQASGWSGQAVTSIVKADGSGIGRDTCEICNCPTCPSCAVCGRSLALVAELMPGTSLDFPWDQTEWATIDDGCRPTLPCEQPMLVAPGPLTARAVYSDSFTSTNMFGADESFIGPSITADTVFQHPATDVVVVSIQ